MARGISACSARVSISRHAIAPMLGTTGSTRKLDSCSMTATTAQTFSCVGRMASAANPAYMSAAQPARSGTLCGIARSMTARDCDGLTGTGEDGRSPTHPAANAAIPIVDNRTLIFLRRGLRVTYLFHQNWRPEELANVESMSCSRMNSRRRSQSCDDCVDPGINGLQRPLTQCITQGASFGMESTRPSAGAHPKLAIADVVSVGLKYKSQPHRPSVWRYD